MIILNKRIKLKKRILHKKCDESCLNHILILDCMLSTNNCCSNCKFKYEADRLIRINEEVKRRASRLFIASGNHIIVQGKGLRNRPMVIEAISKKYNIDLLKIKEVTQEEFDN